MIDIIYKKKRINIRSIWFCNEVSKSYAKRDIDIFHDSFGTFGFSSKHESLICNLNQEENELFRNISKNYRYEINKTQKDDFSIKFYNSIELNRDINILANFESEYRVFTKDKRIKNTFNKKAIRKYIDSGALYLSSIVFNNNTLAQHIYISNNNTARLLYSVSNFRRNNLNSTQVGMANKRLHWEDIVHFKNLGLTTYDWGGISDFDNPNGIDNFKMKFGGNKIEYNVNIVGISALGKFIVFLKRLI